MFATTNALPAELTDSGITEKLGSQFPLDGVLTDSTGATVSSKALFSDGKPVVLVLAYYNCPMLCNLVLTGVADAVSRNPSIAGERYRIITLSIDPSDTPESAAAFSKKYLADVDGKVTQNGWQFLVGSQQTVKRIADSVGYGYKYLPDSGEFAHGAGIIVLTPEGKVSRYLYGIEFKPRDFKLAILEASHRKLVTTTEKVVMYCFKYDPNSKGYALVAVNIMKLGGLVTIIVLGGAIVWLNIKHKDQKNHHG